MFKLCYFKKFEESLRGRYELVKGLIPLVKMLPICWLLVISVCCPQKRKSEYTVPDFL